MAREAIAVGLDIGTTKVCTVVGHGDAAGRITITGVGLVPSRGIRKGVVIDVEDTIAAVRDSVERARHMAGYDFRSVCAGVTGDHIKSSNLRGTITVAGADGTITPEDVERVLQAAALDVPRDREIIHSLPRYFTVDGQRGVRRPVGMRGRRLEVETHIVTGTASFLQNVVQCVEGANLKVDSLVLEPIATSEAVATSDERELGVALIDIGGGTSDIAVFVEGSIAFSGVVPVGGHHVTRDISIGLRTPFDIAERLKIERGVASPSLIQHGEALEILTAGSGERLRLPRAVLGEIIEARMTELFEMARDMLGDAGLLHRLPGGVILTGGGALLPGGLELAGEIFQAPVRLGTPFAVEGWSEQVDSPQFSTAVGLLRFALRHDNPGAQVLPPGALAASGPLAAANLTSPSAPQPLADFNRRAWGAPATEAARVDVGPGPAPAEADTTTPDAAETSEVADSDDTPFDRAHRKANTPREGTENALDAARRERDAFHYDPYDEDREIKPPRTFWQKSLHKLREIIGFEMN